MQLQRCSRIRIVPFVATIIGLLTVACISPTPVTQPGKPIANILAPANNDQVPVGQPTTIQVSAADAQGVTRIEVKVDGALVGTAQSPSPQGQPTLTATQVWVFAAAGSHTITAQAFNAADQASDMATTAVQAVAGVAVQPSPVISAEGSVITGTARSHMFTPAALAAPAPAATDIVIIPHYNGSVRVQRTSVGAGLREVLVPIAIPGALYGQNVDVQEVTVYYKCSSASSYIDHTFLVKQTGASTWTELVNDDTDRTAVADASYTLPVSAGGLSPNAGPLSLNLYLSFANITDTITLGGVCIVLGHQ